MRIRVSGKVIHTTKGKQWVARTMAVGGAALLLVVILLLIFRGTPPTVLYAQDAACHPEESPQLMAWLKLVTPTRNETGVFGEPLDFFLDSEKLGQVRTGDGGAARLTLAPLPRGYHAIEVRTTKGSRYGNKSAILHLLVRGQADSFLIVCMDRTLSTLPREKWSTTPIDQIPVEPGAVEALSHTQEMDWNVIYLTTLSPKLLPKVREWMQRNNFPPGVLSSPSEQRRDDPPALFLTQTVGRFKRSFPSIIVGIAGTPDEARALLDSGIRTVVLQPDPSLAWPTDVSVAQEWGQIAQVFTLELAKPPEPQISNP